MNAEMDFFIASYKALRPPHSPMKWMERMFLRLTDGNPPSLIDLPTGAGKTDVIVIWIIALAWYAQHRDTAKPVPRRLVWVVNRRVLVQQVHTMVRELTTSFADPSSPAAQIVGHLRSLGKKESETVFNVVQLRGQRLDDREWSLDPAMPQLIIGTVDQIGSRLLFQGYGLGKWSRPLHAALLGVDAWVCVDEAHLVPAFAVTLRQVREMACRPTAQSVPEEIRSFFGQLPFWITELSATPGLPRPRYGQPFRLESVDDSDEVIADRLLAKRTRRVIWKALADKKHLARDLAAEALSFATIKPGSSISVFCSFPTTANAVAKTLNEQYPGRVLLVTGRLRGFERDRLDQPESLFRQFRRDHPEGEQSKDSLPTFLVGTAAAEVGLDADSSAIVCDFASLPTLVQRLGRLDRRGQLSKRAKAGKANPPTMTIIGGSNGEASEAQLRNLAQRLSRPPMANGEYHADFFVGAPWSVVVGKEKSEAADDDEVADEESSKEVGGKKYGVADAVTAATWQVLALSAERATEQGVDEPPEQNQGEEQYASSSPETATELTPVATPAFRATRPSSEWLTDPLAGITAGPVAVPPLTDAVLQRWAATTPRSPKFLPVHPWLYGLLPDDEGTPLIGIAFRLELDILRHFSPLEDDEEELARLWVKIRQCLTEFPPLRSELHFVPLNAAKEWLATLSPDQCATLAHFDGDEWTVSIQSNTLGADSVLVLPTSTLPDSIGDIIPQAGDENATQRCWDVFEALSKDGAKYRRQVVIVSGDISPDETGVYRIPEHSAVTDLPEIEELQDEEQSADTSETDDTELWKRSRLKLDFSAHGIRFTLLYFNRHRSGGKVIDLLPDHLTKAGEWGKHLAQAIAPGNELLEALLFRAAKDHDIGKDHDKWQHAMGNTRTWREKEGYDDSIRIAKPVIENPSRLGGYRHEWGTLWHLQKNVTTIIPGLMATTQEFLRDLYLHIIAAHHGYFRPSLPDRGFASPPTTARQNPLRLDAIERSSRLQSQLGYWRLAYLESLIKVADVAATRDTETQELTDDES
jgi:hypothetical protein